MTAEIRLFICIVSLLSFGQLNAQRQFSLGVDYTPSYAYRFLINKDGSSSTASSVAFTNSIERASFGHNIGLSANWQWTKIRLGVGASYMQLATIFKKRDLVYGVLPIPDALPTKIKNIYQQNYITIPLSFAYSFYHKGKWRLGAELKLIPAYYVSNKSINVLYYASGNKERSEKKYNGIVLQDILLGGSIGLAVDYAISERLTAFASPVFYSAFHPLNLNNEIGHIPYSIGLSLGLRRNI